MVRLAGFALLQACSFPTPAFALPRSWDKEAVGVSEVVEGGSVFDYNKQVLDKEFLRFAELIL